MLLFKKEGAVLWTPFSVAPGEEGWDKASDRAEAEPVPPRICSEILGEICFSLMERYN